VPHSNEDLLFSFAKELALDPWWNVKVNGKAFFKKYADRFADIARPVLTWRFEQKQCGIGGFFKWIVRIRY